MFWLKQAHASGKFMPVQGTKIAEHVDSLYSFLLWVSFISCVLVIGGLIYFAIKYRRRSETDKTAYISHSAILEFTWSFIPFVIFMFVFAWGWYVYHQMRTMPKDALEIQVEAKKWSWDFVYKSGRRVSQEFVVPANMPVKLVMTSQDVIHSFFIPAFRIKQDVVPGRYTALWFEAKKPGNYHVFCTEYCGTGHSAMLATVKVVSKEDYNNWLVNDPYKGLSLLQVGAQVFTAKCVACHTATAETKVGPGFLGIWGKTHKFTDGSEALVDENYIRESILNPNAKIVEGFPTGVMPTFQGQLMENEIAGIIEYIKSLK